MNNDFSERKDNHLECPRSNQTPFQNQADKQQDLYTQGYQQLDLFVHLQTRRTDTFILICNVMYSGVNDYQSGQTQIKVRLIFIYEYFYFYNDMIMSSCIRRLLSSNRQCFCSKKLKLVESQLKKQTERKQKLQKFQVQIENFTKKFNEYLQVAKKSPFNYLALFARSCLIANSRISGQLYYPTIKKSLNNNQYQLNPFSCTALMQCFSYFKFQGDQNNVLQKLCNYYQQNCQKFTWIQETVFWESYMKVMTQKAHTSVKFIDLKRKKRQTIQFTTAEKLTTKHPLFKQMPSKFISQVQFPNPNEVSFTLHPPSPASTKKNQNLNQKKRPTILVHVKSITNFNEFQNKDEQSSDQNVHLRRNIIQQITSVKDSIKKQWDIVIVGQLQKWEKQEKYQYTDKDEQGRDIGYVKSQKIQEFVDIIDINDRQNLNKILLSNRYIKGIFYNSNNPNTRRIDTVATLLLGSLPSTKIPHFHSLSPPNPHTFSILSFTPLSTLHEAYGYSSLCNQLYNFNNQYNKIQSLINHKQRNQREQQFNLDILKQYMQEQDVTLEQAKYLLAQNSQMLTDLTIFRANHVSNVILQGKYMQGMQGGFVGDFSWQFKLLFGDINVIMKNAQQKLYENPDKMLKLKIISQKKYIPKIIETILQSKYWSVPVQRQSDRTKAERILEQIEKNNRKMDRSEK